MKDKKEEILLDKFYKDFEETKATNEDIVRIANYLGCKSQEVATCRIYIKEYYVYTKENVLTN